MMFAGWVIFETDLGWSGIAAAGGLLRRTAIGYATRGDLLDWLDEVHGSPRSLVPESACPALVRQFRRFAAGEEISLRHLGIDESWMTPFQKRVIHVCRDIPWGETLTYGQLARLADSPGAGRAVGRVMASNRFPLVVPCHRVRAANGIGGFSAPTGLELKRRMLANEGSQPDVPPIPCVAAD
jgi:methylated-DNA-[protein]-cysteine S-methyltransferase